MIELLLVLAWFAGTWLLLELLKRPRDFRDTATMSRHTTSDGLAALERAVLRARNPSSGIFHTDEKGNEDE